ncbi:MAG: hypothetical protein HFP77_00255 [Methylococcales symbiont of Iophon sp. n. MRB-2018]|nr:MAG: hypothetical protein HFP77_00255 [Methylococcales symbiont of Iophon sp. n. MRB-2018]
MLIINYRGVKLMGLLGLGLDYIMADDDETYNDHGFKKMHDMGLALPAPLVVSTKHT